MRRVENEEAFCLVEYNYDAGAWKQLGVIARGTEFSMLETGDHLEGVERLTFLEDTKFPHIVAAWAQIYQK